MYGVVAYFFGKITSEFPIFLMIPSILTLICFWVLGLNYDPISKFFIFWFTLFSLYMNASGMGMLIGAAVSNKQVAVSLTPIVIIPFMLFSGFFVNQSNIPIFLKPFQYISLFKYGMQALMINEYDGLELDCAKPGVTDPCTPLEDYDSPEGLWLSIGLIYAVGFMFYSLAFLVLWLLSKR